MTSSCWVSISAVFGFLGVACGAFGAHGLEGKIDAHALEVWHTASQYQMYHALALLGWAVWSAQHPGTSAVPGWAFIIGTLIFSGSLYALALSGIKILGAITPIGGLSLLIGWATFAYFAWKASAAV